MKVGILCSGVALGVYIPGLLVNRDLNKKGVSSEVFVLENLIVENKKNKINKNKEAFHKSFKVAKMGQKIAGDIMDSVGDYELEDLLNRWRKDDIREFVVVSGFWLSVIERYINRYPGIDIKCHCLHIDSNISPSWKKVNINPDYCTSEYLFSYDEKRLVQDIVVSEDEPIPFSERENRLLIHGGGWGMGTYQSKIPELIEQGIPLGIVAYNVSEIKEDSNNKYYALDERWSPWMKNSKGLYQFPPFAEVKYNETPKFKFKEEYPGLYDITRNVKAVISKPGGSTLVDSLSAATPIITLEPFGEHEQKNADLWSELGFGISYEEFKKINYKMEVLEELHNNLCKARGKRNRYSDELYKNLK